jgi:hypothetical protein
MNRLSESELADESYDRSRVSSSSPESLRVVVSAFRVTHLLLD